MLRFVFLLAALILLPHDSSAGTKKPNLLILIADDLGRFVSGVRSTVWPNR